VYKDDWYFYHDALSLMTAASTVVWMKNKTLVDGTTYYSHWLLPKFGLNQGRVSYLYAPFDNAILELNTNVFNLMLFCKYFFLSATKYKERPVGNSPEMMPLDNTLNKDLDDAVRRHVACTTSLHPNDPKKFTLSQPKKVRDAYYRCWNGDPTPDGSIDQKTGSPSSDRIVHDVKKFKEALHAIYKSKGTVIHDSAISGGTANGWRGDDTRTLNPKKRGGARKKLSYEASKAEWLHPDALFGRTQMKENARKRYGGIAVDEVPTAPEVLMIEEETDPTLDPDIEWETTEVDTDAF
jgi:hypothetical protein